MSEQIPGDETFRQMSVYIPLLELFPRSRKLGGLEGLLFWQGPSLFAPLSDLHAKGRGPKWVSILRESYTWAGLAFGGWF